MERVINFRAEQLNRPKRNNATQAMEPDDTRSWIRHPDFGPMVRRVRKQRGWTLTQLALRIHCDTGTVGKYERGELPVEYEMACRMADVLHEPKIEEFAAYLVMRQLRSRGPEVA